MQSLFLVDPTQEAGLKRLNEFSEILTSYGQNRNEDRGQNNHLSVVSGLSAHLGCRLISEEMILKEVLEVHDLNEIMPFVSEVFWGLYWKGWLKHRPHLYVSFLEALEEDKERWQNQEAYLKAKRGQTGIEHFDAWVKELKNTGYLHNHARMWFASLWIHTLKLPWTLGAWFFFTHLTDADEASNTLSWRWVAGLHTKGKTYLAQKENIERFTGRTYRGPDPSKEPHMVQENLTTEFDVAPVPDPILIPEANEALLVLPSDLTLWEHLSSASQTARPPLLIADPRSVLPSVQSRKLDFVTKALECQLSQMKRQGHTVSVVNAPEKVPSELLKFSCKSLLTSSPRSGTEQVFWGECKRALKGANMGSREGARQLERLCFPHCTKGFFHLKAHIPQILKEANLLD